MRLLLVAHLHLRGWHLKLRRFSGHPRSRLMLVVLRSSDTSTTGTTPRRPRTTRRRSLLSTPHHHRRRRMRQSSQRKSVRSNTSRQLERWRSTKIMTTVVTTRNACSNHRAPNGTARAAQAPPMASLTLPPQWRRSPCKDLNDMTAFVIVQCHYAVTKALFLLGARWFRVFLSRLCD